MPRRPAANGTKAPPTPFTTTSTFLTDTTPNTLSSSPATISTRWTITSCSISTSSWAPISPSRSRPCRGTRRAGSASCPSIRICASRALPKSRRFPRAISPPWAFISSHGACCARRCSPTMPTRRATRTSARTSSPRCSRRGRAFSPISSPATGRTSARSRAITPRRWSCSTRTPSSACTIRECTFSPTSTSIPRTSSARRGAWSTA